MASSPKRTPDANVDIKKLFGAVKEVKINKMAIRPTARRSSMNRVKAFCKSNVDSLFAQLSSLLAENEFDASSIWNMDETGFSTVPTKVGKVIAVKGLKRVGLMTSQERGAMVTIALAVNAADNSVPPFFLFPRKRMQPCFMDNASPGAVGFANDSEWMQQAEFVKYMEHFIKVTMFCYFFCVLCFFCKSYAITETFFMIQQQFSALRF